MKIEDQKFGVVAFGSELQRGFILHCEAVTGLQGNTAQIQRAADQLHPSAPSRAQAVRQGSAIVQQARIEIGVLMDHQRSLAAISRDNKLGAATLVIGIKSFLVIAGRVIDGVRHDPDLQKVHAVLA